MPIEVVIFIEHIINGLTLGAFYALITLGLSLIFGVARLVNFAHGDIFMVGGYTLFLLLNLSGITLPYPLIVVLVVVVTALVGLLIERVVIHPILNRSWRVQAVATLGISIVLQNLALILFTSDPKQTPTIYSRQIIEIMDIRISVQRLIILVAVIFIFLALQWFVKHTQTGKAMRAVSQNREMCQIVGIDVPRIAMITFAISSGLAGLAAALMSPLFSVMPTMGSLLTLKALAAVILGGLGQVNGAFFAAFLLGLVEALFSGYVSYAYRDVVSFGLFVLILFVRPQGLFGRRVGL
ncbi:MAG: branched-chain amino acid ABC transporter permease [Chloroflexota bacterium]|nr:MAG: branched-chain amino acid ABC transporter permease [Chloroflexota bacterium]